MARIFLSPLIVDIRAKQKDTVFSKWKGVNYIRSRVVPANPQSALQVAIREALAQLVAFWQWQFGTVKINQDYYASGKNVSGFNNYIGKNTVAWKNKTALYITEDNGYDQITSWAGSTGAAAGQISVAFAPTPIPAGKQLIYHVYNQTTKLPEVKGTWAAAATSPQVISGITLSAVCAVVGFLAAVAPSTGDLIGKSMFDMDVVAHA